MERLRLLAALLACLTLPTAYAGADPGALEARRTQAVAAYVEALTGVALWCKKSKLFGKRHDVSLLILEYQPDNAAARKTLKYNRAGSDWTQDPRYKRPRDWHPKLFEQFDRRMVEALRDYRDDVLRVCADAHTSRELSWAAAAAIRLQERLPGDRRIKARLKETLLTHLALLRKLEVPVALEEVSNRLSAHFGSDPDVRRAFGEVEVDGRWLLPATVRARGERQRIVAAAKKALAGVPDVKTATPSQDEGAAGGASRGVYVTEHMRVLGTTTAESLEAIARYCQGAGPFFDATFGVRVEREPTRTFFVFKQYPHWTSFVDAYGPISDEVRAHARAYKGSGYALLTNAYVALPLSSAEAELDLCVDVTFQTLLNEAFAKWHAERRQWQVLPGWVRIGVSDYLTWRLTGKRILTTVGGQSGYGKPPPVVGDRAPKANTKWLEAALATLKRTRAPGTHLMLGKDLGAFTKDDALTSFGLANYLIEGRPQHATRILVEVGKGRKTPEVIKEVLRVTVEALHVEMARWLEETIADR